MSVKRFSMEMVASFAVTALLLAGLGIYGTISYVVNEQRREIAIRQSLGAQRVQLVRQMVLGSRIVAGRVEERELRETLVAIDDGRPFWAHAEDAGYEPARWRECAHKPTCRPR